MKRMLIHLKFQKIVKYFQILLKGTIYSVKFGCFFDSMQFFHVKFEHFKGQKLCEVIE